MMGNVKDTAVGAPEGEQAKAILDESHILCPVKTILRFVYSMERKKPSECNAARKQALQYSLNWLAKL